MNDKQEYNRKHTQKDIKNSLPYITNLSLKEEQWRHLIALLNKHYGGRKLYCRQILECLAEVTQQDYETVRRQTGKKQQLRIAKRKAEAMKEPKKPFKRRHIQFDGLPNPFCFVPHDEARPLPSPLKNLGVQQKPLQPTTPEHGYTEQKRSPNGRLYRPCYTNGVGTLFKQKSPEGSKQDGGRVPRPKARRPLFFTTTPTRAKPMHFKATLEKIEEHQGKKRRCSQKTLTGMTCFSVFEQEGYVLALTSGKNFHWGHMIACFLGGPHNKENLTPGTDAANYNTLDIVERYIAEKLALKNADGSKLTECIAIKITPVYTNQHTMIAEQLIFALSWQENNEAKTETIYIVPTSFNRINAKGLASIEALRAADSLTSSTSLI